MLTGKKNKKNSLSIWLGKFYQGINAIDFPGELKLIITLTLQKSHFNCI
jgi:hypothetical protein